MALLVCRVDGDIACGALTADLQLSETHVAWTDWPWESYQGARTVENVSEPLLFDRTTYEAQLSAALAMVQAMPYDELADPGKRFLWPWEWGWGHAAPRGLTRGDVEWPGRRPKVRPAPMSHITCTGHMEVDVVVL